MKTTENINPTKVSMANIPLVIFIDIHITNTTAIQNSKTDKTPLILTLILRFTK